MLLHSWTLTRTLNFINMHLNFELHLFFKGTDLAVYEVIQIINFFHKFYSEMEKISSF